MRFNGRYPKKILIINIFGIGDVLFTTPLISNLKVCYPDIKIGYICNQRTADILRQNSKVDQIFICDSHAYNEACQESKILAFKKMMEFLRQIRKEKFDISIDVSMSRFTNCVTWLCGVKCRVGFQYKNRNCFLHKKFPLKGYEDKHVVEYYLSLLEELGIPVKMRDLELNISQSDDDWSCQFLQKHLGGGGCRPVIGIVPGGGASWGKDAVYKRWSPEKYAKLADNLIEKFSATIILMGDQSELALCAQVDRAMMHASVLAAGETTIGQFAALARRCSLMIVNDGGPLHIAVAAGAKTASIFGPVDERVYGPYPPGNHIIIKKDLVCRPCYRRFRKAQCDHISCLDQLTVEDVLEGIKKAL